MIAQAVARAVAASQRWGRFRLRKTRPPSICQIGSRLNRLMKAPNWARAAQIFSWVAVNTKRANDRRAQAPGRTGQGDPRVLAGIGEFLPQANDGPQAGNE